MFNLKTYLFTVFIFYFSAVFGVVEFGDQQIITMDNVYQNGARSVFATDIDGDGDSDLIAALGKEDKIVWFENIDGKGNFSEEKTVAGSVDGPASLFSVDIDGDEDSDVACALLKENKIVWFENIDGKGSFSEAKTVTDGENASSIHLADIDGDGDFDLLFSSSENDTVGWYENIDGKGSFSEKKEIATSVFGASAVFASDLDGDKDSDVLSASIKDNKIAWYENGDGRGKFGEQQEIDTSVSGASYVFAADLDGDSDLDVLSTSFNYNKILWYENLDGKGSFSEQKEISYHATEVKVAIAADLDLDGDNDIIAGYSNKIVMYENLDGKGDFSKESVVTDAVEDIRSIVIFDPDGDSDPDLASASYGEGKVAWYKNLLIDETEEGDEDEETSDGDADEGESDKESSGGCGCSSII